MLRLSACGSRQPPESFPPAPGGYSSHLDNRDDSRAARLTAARGVSAAGAPPASACPGPDGPAPSLGLSGVFRRLRLPTMRRAGAGRASAAIPGTGGRAGALARSWRCAAAALLLALAALLALPLQAQAQTEVWSGTLTVRNNSGVLGCSNGFANNFCSVHLTDDDFTHASTDYAITLIFLRTNGRLELTFDTDLATATQGLTLNVDGTDFAFEDADTQSATNRSWNSTSLSWSVGDSVSLTLTEPAASTDATLSSLALEDNNGTTISLTAGATRTYTASVVNSVDEITVLPTVNDSNATYEIQHGDGTALTDADTNTTGFQVAIDEGENTVKVEVTAEDGSTILTYTITVTREDVTPPSPESALTCRTDRQQRSTLSVRRRRGHCGGISAGGGWSLPSRSPPAGAELPI